MSNLKINMPRVTGYFKPSFLSSNEYRQLVESFLGDDKSGVTSGFPITDSYFDKRTNHQVIDVALAGYTKDMIDIKIQSNKITIESDGAKDEYDVPVKRNIARRSFKKSFVDYDNRFDMQSIEAEYKNGLLKVFVPLKKEEKEFKINIG